MSKENTVRIHRVFAAKPEKLYRAFLDPGAMAKWISPNGFTCTVHHMEPKVGGTYKMSFTNFTTGKSEAFGGTFKELEPNKKLVYTDRFENPDMPNEIQVTILLKEVSVGTEVNITQENLPEQIPVEGCYLGWQDSLNNLARLVEPDIKDGF